MPNKSDTLCLSSDDDGDSSDGEGEQSADPEDEVEQSADSEHEVALGNNRRPVCPGGCMRMVTMCTTCQVAVRQENFVFRACHA
jgi:hypothetical protein